MTMLNSLKVVISGALVLGAASTALAANKHVVRHERIAPERVMPRVQTPWMGYNSYGYAPGYNAYAYDQGYNDYAYANTRGHAYRPGYTAYDPYQTPMTGEETYQWIQDQDYRRSN